MTPFPRPDYAALGRYDPGRAPVALDLSDNTNLWGTHPDALTRIRAAGPDDLARYPTLYADELRAAVGERFGVDPECVTTGAGSDDVLDSAFRAATGPDAAAAFAAPTFSMARELALMNGMVPRPVPWPDALSDPETLLDRDPAVVYVCRPNNPTGDAAPAAWVEQLLKLSGERGPLVIVDEAYADFSDETLIPLATGTPNLLVTRTCSKAYGLAGLRCGYGVARPDVVLEVDKSRGPYKVARLAAEAAAAALIDRAGWMPGVVAECRENRERLRSELASRDLGPLESVANFIIFAAPSGTATGDALALRELGVQLRPFSGVPGLGEGLRVTVGPWPLVERFLEVLDRRLADLEEVASR